MAPLLLFGKWILKAALALRAALHTATTSTATLTLRHLGRH